MTQLTDREKAFAKFLEKLAQEKNRAALAALRRGLGKDPGQAAEMYPYIVPWLSADPPPLVAAAYYHVAAWFAWHQGSWPDQSDETGPTNLGASFARLAAAVDSKSLESRFVALLNCHPDDLPQHLRHAVGLLKSKNIPVDWAQLLHDFQAWGWESRAVQKKWARAFWRQTASPTTQEAPAEEAVEGETSELSEDDD